MHKEEKGDEKLKLLITVMYSIPSKSFFYFLLLCLEDIDIESKCPICNRKEKINPRQQSILCNKTFKYPFDCNIYITNKLERSLHFLIP